MGQRPQLHLVQYPLLPTSIFTSSSGYNIKGIFGFYNITLPLFSIQRISLKIGSPDAQGIHCFNEPEVSTRRKKCLPPEHHMSQFFPKHN